MEILLSFIHLDVNPNPYDSYDCSHCSLPYEESGDIRIHHKSTVHIQLACCIKYCHRIHINHFTLLIEVNTADMALYNKPFHVYA